MTILADKILSYNFSCSGWPKSTGDPVEKNASEIFASMVFIEGTIELWLPQIFV